MAIHEHGALPDPDKATVAAWLSDLSLGYVHGPGWIEVNERMHAIAIGGRAFARKNFKEAVDRRMDFLDGVAFGVLAVLHASDVDTLNHQLATTDKLKSDSLVPLFIEPALGQDFSAAYDGGEDQPLAV
jgi:hypothetical protein